MIEEIEDLIEDLENIADEHGFLASEAMNNPNQIVACATEAYHTGQRAALVMVIERLKGMLEE